WHTPFPGLSSMPSAVALTMYVWSAAGAPRDAASGNARARVPASRLIPSGGEIPGGSRQAGERVQELPLGSAERARGPGGDAAPSTERRDELGADGAGFLRGERFYPRLPESARERVHVERTGAVLRELLGVIRARDRGAVAAAEGRRVGLREIRPRARDR